MSLPLDGVPARSDDVPGLVARHLPRLIGRPVRFLGAGWDNACYLVDDVVLRLSVQEHPDVAVRDEAGVLALVTGRLTCEVPTPMFVDPGAGAMAYRLVAGDQLVGALRECLPSATASALGVQLALLHSIPLDEALRVVRRKDRTPTTLHRDAVRGFEACASALPGAVRRPVERFLSRTPPAPGHREALCHNDLASEHVVVDPRSGALVGVIDWADARVTDPMADLGGLYRDVGPAAAHSLLGAYREAGGVVEDGALERVRFFARCALVLDLEHAVATGVRRHWDEALRVLPHTLG